MACYTYNGNVYFRLPWEVQLLDLVPYGCDCDYCHENHTLEPRWDTLNVTDPREPFACHFPALEACGTPWSTPTASQLEAFDRWCDERRGAIRPLQRLQPLQPATHPCG